MNLTKRLSTREAAAYCGLSPRTFEKLRLTGRGPEYEKPGGLRRCVYPVDSLDRWLSASRRRSTSAPVAA